MTKHLLFHYPSAGASASIAAGFESSAYAAG